MDSVSIVMVLMASALVVVSCVVGALGYAFVRAAAVLSGVSARQDAMLRDAHNRILLSAQNQMDRAILETEAAKFEFAASRAYKEVPQPMPGYAEPPAQRVYNPGEYPDMHITDRTGGPD